MYIGANFGWIGSTDNTITNTGTDTGAAGLGAALAAGAIPGTVGVKPQQFHRRRTDRLQLAVGPELGSGPRGRLRRHRQSEQHTVISAFPGNAAIVPLQTGYARALDSLGTVRGRVGYLSSPSFLWYATGGLAYGETKLQTAFACATCGPPVSTVNLTDNWQVGWTVGAGVEWKFAPQWSVKAEYLYVDLGNISNTINYNYGPSSSLTSTYNERDNIVRAGINYKFW